MPRKKVDTKNKTLKEYTVFTAKDEIERDFGRILLFSTKYDIEGKKIKRHFENHHVLYEYYNLEKEENKKILEEKIKKNKLKYEDYKNKIPIVIINEKILVQPTIKELNKTLLIEDTQARELYDLIIVGGGLSGFFTALNASILGLKTIIIEQKTLLYRLENIPWINFISYNEGLEGRELSLRLNYDFETYNDIKLIEGSYAKRLKKIGDLYEVSTEGAIYRSKTVVLSTGAEYQRLNIFGENTFYNKKLYYSDEYYTIIKTNDLEEEKIIGIAGEGIKIYEDALLLSEKTKNIVLFDLNQNTKISGLMKKKLEEKNIKVLKNIKLLEFRGKNYLEEIKYHDFEKNKNYILKFDYFFVILKNLHTNNSWLKPVLKLKEGKIIVEDYETNLKGVYAIGNCIKDYYKEYKTTLQESGYIIKKINFFLKEWKQKEKNKEVSE